MGINASDQTNPFGGTKSTGCEPCCKCKSPPEAGLDPFPSCWGVKTGIGLGRFERLIEVPRPCEPSSESCTFISPRIGSYMRGWRRSGAKEAGRYWLRSWVTEAFCTPVSVVGLPMVPGWFTSVTEFVPVEIPLLGGLGSAPSGRGSRY